MFVTHIALIGRILLYFWGIWQIDAIPQSPQQNYQWWKTLIIIKKKIFFPFAIIINSNVNLYFLRANYIGLLFVRLAQCVGEEREMCYHLRDQTIKKEIWLKKPSRIETIRSFRDVSNYSASTHWIKWNASKIERHLGMWRPNTGPFANKIEL